MTENPESDFEDIPQNPEDSETEGSGLPDDVLEDEFQSGVIDPLSALRQDMIAEEQQPDPSQKSDILSRMTGGLGSRKSTPRTKNQNPSDMGFGVRTNRNSTASEPFNRTAQATSEDFHDEFLEKRLGTGPLTPLSADTDENTEEQFPIHIDGDPKAEGGLFSDVPSKVTSPFEPTVPMGTGRKLDPLYDEMDLDQRLGIDTSGPKQTDPHMADDRKVLGSGAERQFEVNRFLLYNPKKSLKERFDELSNVEKLFLLLLVGAVVVVIGLITFLYIDSRKPDVPVVSGPTAAVTRTVQTTQEAQPIPTGLKLPGGWSFQLKQGTLVDGKWLPKTSEWLTGTEMRKVIAIPWNRQIEAVINTFEPNFPIEVYMNNGDTLIFKVQSVSLVSVADASVMSDTRPSLAIILINPGDEKRWVVIAYP